MHYICKDSLCDCYGNCPANHRLTVTEHSDVDDDTGLSLYFAICPTTGQTLTSLYEYDLAQSDQEGTSANAVPPPSQLLSHANCNTHKQPGKGFSHSTLVGSSYNKVSIAKNAQDITIGATTLHITSVKIWEFLDKVIAAHQKDGLATCDRKILKSMTSTDAKKLQDLLDWEEYPLGAAERIGNTRYTGKVKFKLSR